MAVPVSSIFSTPIHNHNGHNHNGHNHNGYDMDNVPQAPRKRQRIGSVNNEMENSHVRRSLLAELDEAASHIPNPSISTSTINDSVSGSLGSYTTITDVSVGGADDVPELMEDNLESDLDDITSIGDNSVFEYDELDDNLDDSGFVDII